MKYIFSNNATSTLLGSITSSATTFQVQAGHGQKFPPATTARNEGFQVTLIDNTGSHEICECFSRSGDTMSVVRARENTLARSWASGTRVEARLTATMLQLFLQKVGGLMQGPLDMVGNSILRTGYFEDGLWTHTVQTNAVRQANDVDNRWGLTLHSNSLPDVNGDPILIKSDLMGLIFMWSGTEASLNKDVWKLCNGSNGTPDLRDRFILASGSLYDPLATFPVDRPATLVYETGASGRHSHGGNTAGHVLTRSEIPSHTHNVAGGGLQAGGIGYRTDATENSRGAQVTDGGNVGGQAHTHGITETDAHRHTVAPPAFFVLAFVMLK